MDRVWIRQAREVDVADVHALVQAAYGVYLERLPMVPVPLSADYATLVSAGACRVAATPERVVGLLVLWPRGDHLLIENLAVHPDAQRHGIGGLLLGRAEQEARDAGLDVVRLYTNAWMRENLAYYARHGFHETARTGDTGHDRVFLEKRLA
jgi:N-acetylglutamate synthase-like GNAT family acetyltransferase